MSGVDWVDRVVREAWAREPGMGLNALLQEAVHKCEEEQAAMAASVAPDLSTTANSFLPKEDATTITTPAIPIDKPPHPSMITKARIKHSKTWIPYRQILPSNNNNNNNNVELDESQLQFVQTKIQERLAFRANRQYALADNLAKALEAMGIELDDQYKTWKVIREPPPLPATAVPLAKQQPPSSQPTTKNRETNANKNLPVLSTKTSCKFCGKLFNSRNDVFKHLRDPITSGCGTAIFAAGQQIAEPPSAKHTQQRRKHSKTRRQAFCNQKGHSARHASAENSLWVGNLPLPWTNPKRQFSHLRALLFHYVPRNIPTPWIKRVVRKAYRKGPDGLYYGYAIVVFRDDAEAIEIRQLLDKQHIDPTRVFQQHPDSSSNGDLAPFLLEVGPAKSGDTFLASWNGITATPSNVGGQDPPLVDQLRTLGQDELRRRIHDLEKQFPDSQFDMDEKKDDTVEDSNNEDVTERLLSKLSSMYSTPECGRRVVRRIGRPIPFPIRDKILNLLESLRWPARNERGGLAAERYLVLQTNTDRFYGELRDACRELMDWADPEYYYSGIAVTKNFVASPHIDHRDRSFQYAVSLGDFQNGGELCVEGEDLSTGHRLVNVVNTQNRIARVDGRHVHYVRTWEGGDRYSLIFYDTSYRNPTPMISLGVDEVYIGSTGTNGGAEDED